MAEQVAKQVAERQIVHVDMDAFYASVEQRDDPSLQGKPVIVGGKPNSRGVVSTASYEARKAGVHSAMPLAEAWRRCPQGIFLPVNGRKYREVSGQIRQIFLTYTPLVEPLSLDEAFLDVTASSAIFGPAASIGHIIKERIRDELGLTASVGVAGNKFLAKLASDLRKPDGFVVVPAEGVQEFLDPLPVERIWGVGQKTAERLHGLNVKTVRDLRRLDASYLKQLFGVLGGQLYELARGRDERPVENERETKSIGRETTFGADVGDRDFLEGVLLELSCDVGQGLRREKLKGRTITLKVRYQDFRTLARSCTLAEGTNLDDVIYRETCRLFRAVALKQPLRLIGVSVHQLAKQEEGQLSLFADDREERENLARVIDEVREKYGAQSIMRARLLSPTGKNQADDAPGVPGKPRERPGNGSERKSPSGGSAATGRE
ncbi:DNA-directed DNA polymerase [Acididesulfobacillus acetoxydans]|uniref:DNA polymerase IV n=1 Tax=Acididesulfobacillus acetoxydans TaxID=1561005 RepID=A0A8S0WZT3_9FIRM|nr:DNA polymerase IV [Acididesulfobacillus acetoxydans]CAA7602151.1 DNA-directed DNA polymerase [Acididesulfobacillus acetoxydans]CEJ08005.1 DNA polymerase IV [Acididesulfobacillus acetoxydans]